MKRLTTTLLCMMLTLFAASVVHAQTDVTVREINAIAVDNINQLNQLGENLTSTNINNPVQGGGEGLIFNDLYGEQVRFTAVVLSNPRNSGLATPVNGLPGRIHVFVRDITAATEGNEGMGLQLVDQEWDVTGLHNVAVGDVITVVGDIEAYYSTLQFAPISIELQGTYQSLSLPETIMDPVVVTTADVNKAIGTPGNGNVQVNWDNFASLRGQYVRIEGATVLTRAISEPRVDWLITSDGGETVVNIYDSSLRYRNDRGTSYNETEYNVLDDDFVPPPPGSAINLQGFLALNWDDPFARAIPEGALVSLNPFEDSDLEITATPPVISNLSKPDFVPGTDPITITVNVDADPTRSITGAALTYTMSTGKLDGTIDMVLGGDGKFSADIPAAADGEYVTYYVTGTDNTGASSESDPRYYRVLVDGINSIEDVQRTSDGGPGDSPFRNITTAMDITVTVQNDPAVSGIIVVQDDPALGPWSGVLLDATDALLADLVTGDVINITEARIYENYSVTEMEVNAYTKTGTGDPYGYKTMTTDIFQDLNLAEAYEGVMVRFENVTVTEILSYGEWSFSSDGTMENSVDADDLSNALSSSFAGDTFTPGETYSFMQGVWWFSYYVYKLVPESADTDIGVVTNVGTEGEKIPGTFALRQNYPNPFNPVTNITYAVPTTGRVTLEVFDMLGRSVALLVDRDLTPGAYEARFDARNLSSGMYLYRLTAGSRMSTQKMILMK